MAPTTASPSRRLYGLDAARAAAVIGMIAVHLRPQKPSPASTGPADVLLNLPHGRASLLFMTLAGVGVALLIRRHGGVVGRDRATLLWRAGLLLLIGLALQTLDHGVSVILQTYGVMFVLALILVRLPGPALLAGATLFTLVGPVFLVLNGYTASSEWRPPQLGDDPLTIVSALLVTGRYPLVTWIVPFLVGLWIGRQPLADPSFQRRLALVGGGLALVAITTSQVLARVLLPDDASPGLHDLASGVAHSQMPLWLIEGVGVACALIGLALAVERLLPPRVARLAWPVYAFGQLALTFYIGHLLLIAGVLRPHGWPADAWAGVGILTTIVLAGLIVAPAWLSRFRYGPAEHLMRLPRITRRDRDRLLQT